MRVYHDFFLVPGSKSAFPYTDPDPAKWYGSETLHPDPGGGGTEIYTTLRDFLDFFLDFTFLPLHKIKNTPGDLLRNWG